MASRTLVCLLSFISLAGVVAAEDVNHCDIKPCLDLYIKTLPPCNVDGQGYICLRGLESNCTKYWEKKTEDNEKITKETQIALVHAEHVGYKHAMKTVCDQNNILAQYRKKPHCWYGGIQCGRLFDFTAAETQKQYFCKTKVFVKDDCIKNIGLPSDCHSLHEEFVNLMFKASPCGATAIAIQTLLLILGVVVNLNINIGIL